MDVNDEFQTFLNKAMHVIKEAQCIADAVPNIELEAIEHAVRQLYGIRRILQSVVDPHFPPKSVATISVATLRLQLKLWAQFEAGLSQAVVTGGATTTLEVDTSGVVVSPAS
ncbi:hypothetical protein K439DRAFT_1612897 [Ramaria rubella]|nr:hypothetical protein K439DRAFT_1612897 [Ramaria rubella]